jgi:hypothetical protein
MSCQLTLLLLWFPLLLDEFTVELLLEELPPATPRALLLAVPPTAEPP